MKRITQTLLALALMIVANVSFAQYGVQWVDMTGATESNGILTKTTATGYAVIGGARATNALATNTNGWVEFTITNQKVQIGFAVNDVLSQTTFTHSIQISSTNVITVYEGATATTFGAVASGNVFRISREGNKMKYYKGGVLLRSANISTNPELYVRALIYGAGETTPAVNCSFDKRILIRPTILGIEGPSGAGSIAANAIGGATPYTYSWASGGTTVSKSTTVMGNQAVTVSDAAGRSATYTYGLGFKSQWLNQVGENESSGTLIKTAADGWGTAGAVGSNVLNGSTDGWLEFVVASANSNAVIGFASSAIGYINTSGFTNGFYLRGTDGVLLTYEGATSTSVGNWIVGDILRISREGTSMKYLKNGVVLRTVTISNVLNLMPKAALYSGTTPPVTTSFQNLIVQSTIMGTNATDGTGNVTTNILSGKPPYTYAWSTGELTASINNKNRGSYVLNVTDAGGRTASRTLAVGYKYYWTGLNGVTDNSGVLTKTGAAGWNAGAVTVNVLPPNTNGWLEFVSPAGSYYEIGFATNLTTFSNTTFTNALRLDNNNALLTYEGTTSNSTYGTWSEGDVWRISREGSQVKYYRNGVVFRTVSVSASLQLYGKAVVYSGTTPPVNSSFWIPASEGNVPDIAEFNILKDLYTSTAGTNWTTKTNWPTTWPASATSAQMATWFGITVTNNDIAQIQLGNNNLVGTLPASLTNLASLTQLVLNNNQISGSLPTGLNSLAGLTVLNTQNNLFTGSLPDLSSLTLLTNLSLGGNVGLTAGSVPSWIANMPNLAALNLASTNRTGSIPVFVSTLNLLSNLQLNNNQLTGSIDNLVYLPALVHLNASNNQLTGTLPPAFGNNAQMQTLNLGNNQFFGSIPLAYRNITALINLYLNNNQLEGAVPNLFATLPNLQYIDFSNNQLTGTFPASVNTISGLKELRLNNNGFRSVRTAEPIVTAIPNLKAHPNKANLDVYVANNYLDFIDLEPYFTSAHGLKSFNYSPQLKYPDVDKVVVPIGGTFVLTAIGTGVNGTVVWEKLENSTWTNITSQSEDGTTKTFRQSNVTAVNGLYRWTITNSIVPALALQSENIEVFMTDPLSSTAPNVVYNGLITSIHWRTSAPLSSGEGLGGEVLTGKYNFTYDDKYQIQEANWYGPGGVLTSGNKFRLDNMTYDPNGNILTLKRYDEYGLVKNNFSYKYANSLNPANNWQSAAQIVVEGISSNNDQERNQLLDVNGYTASNPPQHGFKYNAIGQMTEEDLLEGDDQFVEYDVTGKVRKVFSDAAKTQLKVEFKYDDRGFRLSKKNLAENRTYWYIRDASGNILSMYEEDHANGNALNQTEIPVYGSGKLGTYYANQDGSVAYELTDHLGNVRAVVRENVNEYTATMEDTGVEEMENPRVTEGTYFQNLYDTEVDDWRMNHTAPSAEVAEPSMAAYLRWQSGVPGMSATDKSIGPAISLKVKKGDKLDIETFARYREQSNYPSRGVQLATLASFLGGVYSFRVGFEGSLATEVAQHMEGGLAAIFNTDDGDVTRPFAYLNYIVFDNNLVSQDAKRVRITEAAAFETGQEVISMNPGVGFEQLTWDEPITIGTDGYIYVWVSNESENVEVWFDDLKVSHTQLMTTQATDYGVWGDVVREEKLDESTYCFGYQGQFAEKDEETGWNHFQLREYDPIVGRWIQKDPMGQYFSPYIGMGNSPVGSTDPNGGRDNFTLSKDGKVNLREPTNDHYHAFYNENNKLLFTTSIDFNRSLFNWDDPNFANSKEYATMLKDITQVQIAIGGDKDLFNYMDQRARDVGWDPSVIGSMALKGDFNMVGRGMQVLIDLGSVQNLVAGQNLPGGKMTTAKHLYEFLTRGRNLLDDTKTLGQNAWDGTKQLWSDAVYKTKLGISEFQSHFSFVH